MNFKKAWIALAAAILVLGGIITLVVLTVASPLPNGENSSEPTEQVTIERTLSGKSAAEDKEDVLAAAAALLSSVEAPSSPEEFEEYMAAIEAGTVPLPEELSSKIRLVDSLATETGIESTIFQTLVTFATFAKQSSGSDAIVPLYDDAANGIVLDQEAGVAYVPTTLFVNSGSGVNGFSMEFIYLDGEWIFSPYMTLDELRLALVLQGEVATPQG